MEQPEQADREKTQDRTNGSLAVQEAHAIEDARAREQAREIQTWSRSSAVEGARSASDVDTDASRSALVGGSVTGLVVFVAASVAGFPAFVGAAAGIAVWAIARSRPARRPR